MNAYRMLATVVVLSAASGLAAAQELPSSAFPVMVAGRPAQQHDLASLQEHLAPVFKEDGFDVTRTDDIQKLDAMAQAILAGGTPEKAPAVFGGFEGLSTALAVRTLASLAAGRPLPRVKGKILSHVYDGATGAGHLMVHVEVDHFDDGGRLHQRDHLRWDVRIKARTESPAGGYTAVPRVDTATTPEGFFPGTIPLPPELTDRQDLRSIFVRGLDHKLFAKGPDQIEVQHVYLQKQTAAGLAPLSRFPPGHVFYQTTADSCIDIMFAGEPPALHLPPQVGYCLGRCQHPWIMNSN